MTTSTNSVANRFRMDGRVALIVGAGRGIGAASAIALAEAGCDLVLASRTEPQVTEVAERAAELGVDAVPMASDATDPEACEALVDATVSRFGRLDVLVSVVGGSMPRSFMDTSDRMLGAAFERNVIDGLRLVRLAVPHLLRSDAASVVMVSSDIDRLLTVTDRDRASHRPRVFGVRGRQERRRSCGAAHGQRPQPEDPRQRGGPRGHPHRSVGVRRRATRNQRRDRGGYAVAPDRRPRGHCGGGAVPGVGCEFVHDRTDPSH